MTNHSKTCKLRSKRVENHSKKSCPLFCSSKSAFSLFCIKRVTFECQVQKMQVVQNSATRLIYCIRKHEIVSSYSKRLIILATHSLSHFIQHCVIDLRKFAPSYLIQLVKHYTSSRNLRSNKKTNV